MNWELHDLLLPVFHLFEHASGRDKVGGVEIMCLFKASAMDLDNEASQVGLR
jgi:hypothetical protein